MTHTRHITADRGDDRQRIDLVLRRHLGDLDAATRTRVQDWIHSGRVQVNGTVVRRVAARAAAGDAVTVAIPDSAMAERAVMLAEPRGLAVLYEDAAMLAVDKPAGIVVHPAYRNVTGTLMNALLWRARAWPAGQRPSIVGRLDRHTSGIVLIAKTAAMHAALQRAMASIAARKEYLALTYGRVAARGKIDVPLARDVQDRRRMAASARDGRVSLTRFERVAYSPRAGVSLVRCSLVTGRTHQIRVHLALRGWPIVGDPIYGANGNGAADPAFASALRQLSRCALHAWRTSFVHPATGQRVVIDAPLPPDLASLIAIAGLADSGAEAREGAV